MLRGFGAFLARGNLLDLAVAVVIGAAFNAVVQALVKDLVTPLIAAIAGKPNFASLAVVVNHSRFLYGDFLNAVLTFLIDALVVYYLVVVPAQRLEARLAPRHDDAPAVKVCPECLSDVPAAARRCKYCTSPLAL